MINNNNLFLSYFIPIKNQKISFLAQIVYTKSATNQKGDIILLLFKQVLY